MAILKGSKRQMVCCHRTTAAVVLKTRGNCNRLIGTQWGVCDGGRTQGLKMLFVVIPQTGPRCGPVFIVCEAKSLNLIPPSLCWLPSFDHIVLICLSPPSSLYLHLYPPLCR